MKKALALFAGVLLAIVLAACSEKGAAPIERATLSIDSKALIHVCRVSYRSLNREIPCDRIATVMRTELRIPTSVHVVLQPSTETRYEEVGALIQSLNDSGYLIGFPTRL